MCGLIRIGKVNVHEVYFALYSNCHAWDKNCYIFALQLKYGLGLIHTTFKTIILTMPKSCIAYVLSDKFLKALEQRGTFETDFAELIVSFGSAYCNALLKECFPQLFYP